MLRRTAGGDHPHVFWRSEFHMQPEGGHHDRSAIAIVARIVDLLHAGSDINTAPNMGSVIGFHNVFATIAQASVAEEKSEAAIGQIGLMVFADSIRYECDASAILLAMPFRAVRDQPLQKSRIHL